MRVGIMFLLLILIYASSFAFRPEKIATFTFNDSSKKPIIDTNVFAKWPSIGYSCINNNGNYIFYIIRNQPIGSGTLVIQSADKGWRKEFVGVSIAYFVNDKQVLFNQGQDSVCIQNLGEDSVWRVSNVSSYKMSNVGLQVWLAYKQKSSSTVLVLRNLVSGVERHFEKVNDFLFNDKGNTLLLLCMGGSNNKQSSILEWLNLTDGKVKTIWAGITAGNFAFTSEQLAFIGKRKENDENPKSAIWLYKNGMDLAIELINNKSFGIDKEQMLADEQLVFSKDGGKLFFTVQNNISHQVENKSGSSDVYIWSYKDKYLQSEQLSSSFQRNLRPRFRSVINIHAKNIVQLEDEKIKVYPNQEENHNFYTLGFKKGYPDEYYNKDDCPVLYLISINNGDRQMLSQKALIGEKCLSPDENFVIWFDLDKLCYFSYEIKTGIKRNISQRIPVSIYDDEAAKIGRYEAFGLAAWFRNEDCILIYDQYDIWKLDLKGVKNPVNITNYFGRRHQIVLGLIEDEDQFAVIDQRDDLLLGGYDELKKRNGFFKIKKGSHDINFEVENMEKYIYYVPRIGKVARIEYARGTKPIKAKNLNRYLVTRMSAAESPNLFITNDFKRFVRISDLFPEKKYNWLTSELINWRMSDGRMSQGILYKPEDFDSTKKYPVIFTYYEKRSDQLNEYINPDFCSGRINISSYVSNGYLVFVPDIYYAPGYNGKGVVNAVISAAEYLSRFSWIDSKRIGLQGHSFAGWETNFLITHSNIFAAACEASGVSDQVSGYGQLSLGLGTDRQRFYEMNSQGSPYGIGITPWTNPDFYIQNSPVFYIDKVTTPLLMMHGNKDMAVPYEQAMEMFLGLKRAGKKVWLLQYQKAGHGLIGEDARDFTIRMQQFFNYYLKGSLPPVWMTDGVPAEFRNNFGYELDLTGKIP